MRAGAALVLSVVGAAVVLVVGRLRYLGSGRT